MPLKFVKLDNSVMRTHFFPTVCIVIGYLRSHWISMFPLAPPQETLRFLGNKINCFPRDKSECLLIQGEKLLINMLVFKAELEVSIKPLCSFCYGFHSNRKKHFGCMLEGSFSIFFLTCRKVVWRIWLARKCINEEWTCTKGSKKSKVYNYAEY